MKKTRQEKAITLVALIITIIVILILAVTTISAVKEGGIIQYAHNAKTEYEEKSEEDKEILKTYLDLIDESDPTEIVRVGEKAIKNSTINGKAFSSTNPVIPKGFCAINIADTDSTDNIDKSSTWDLASGPEVYKGLVITDEVDSKGNSIGNEFVWIPVPTLNSFARPISEGATDYRSVLYDWDTDNTGETEYEWSADREYYREPYVLSTQYDTENLSYFNISESLDEDTDVDIEDLKIYMQRSFNKMIQSVAKYKGFYVGRYETSFESGVAESKVGKIPMGGINWYDMYSNSKTYSTSNTNLKVTSEMIWGCQWDAMLKFILDTQDASHVTVATNAAHTNIARYRTGGTNYYNNYNLKDEAAEGFVKYNDRAANIYDLEGNMGEWTQEAASSYRRTVRATSCRYDEGATEFEPPTNRGITVAPDITWAYRGSRMSLYVEV